MTPYYEEPGVEIYHGDALEVLDALRAAGRRFRNVCMDPPYASGARTEAKKPSSGAMVRGARWNAKPIENDQMTTAGFIWLMRETCLAFRDMLDDGDSVFSFIDWRQWPNLLGAIESTNLRANQMIVWDKDSMGLGNGFRAQHELVLHASKGTPRVTNKSFGNALRHKRADDPDHPSPKPPALLEDLLTVVTIRATVSAPLPLAPQARTGGHPLPNIAIGPCHRCGADDRRPNGHCNPCFLARSAATKAARMQRPCARCGAVERRANGQCKACQRAWAKSFYSTPEGKAKKRASRPATPEEKAAAQAQRSTEQALEHRRKQRTRDKHRAWEREYARRPDVVLRKNARRYKIAPADLAELIKAQEGKCAACGDDLVPGRHTHIDHDHKTGKVRGLLCKDCNLAEGFLRGSARRARLLAEYIARHSPEQLHEIVPPRRLRPGARAAREAPRHDDLPLFGGAL